MVKASNRACKLLLVVAFMAGLSSVSFAGGLQYNFYGSSCPKAEDTVRNVVEGIIYSDASMAAAFIRLFFHDCFVRGCDASILLNSTKSNTSTEKTTIPLRGYDAVNKIKAAVEAVCPGKVSCADILAFAARDSAILSGNFGFAMLSGRRDGLVSVASEVLQNLPSPLFQLQDLIDSFDKKNLNVDDLVALSGAHSIGFAHCSTFANRLFPVDPTMNDTFAAGLKADCPAPSSTGTVNNNRVAEPDTLSNQYYKNLQAGEVLFTSDQALVTRNDTAAKVADNAANPVAWMARFAVALVKMGGVEVLTGTDGEIRKVCYATNS